MISAFKRLRELMVGRGHGAWLSVTVTAKPDGKCSFDYNHDAPPGKDGAAHRLDVHRGSVGAPAAPPSSFLLGTHAGRDQVRMSSGQ